MESKFPVLQKFLSQIGFASRRKSESLITQNLIKINGKVAKLGDRINPKIDKITVNGEEIKPLNNKKIYVALHKPRGFVTTMSDEKNRKCVADLLKDVPGRVYPIGRLDKDSEGLLLATNDGDFANKIMHPAGDIYKTYRVTLRSKITEKQIDAITFGVEIDETQTLPAKVRVLSCEKNRTVLEISIKEGKNRQIRKMCEALGLEVSRLKRISISAFKLGMLPPGKWRELTKEEIKLF